MKIALGVLLFACTSLFGADCALTGVYSTLAGTAGHYTNHTGTGCTGGSFIPGNGDSVTLTGAALTIAPGESWSIGISGTSSTTDVTLAASTILTVNGAMTYRGGIFMAASTVINGGGSLIHDSSLSATPASTFYPIELAGNAVVNMAGNSATCTYSEPIWTGAGCAVLTSITTNSAAFGYLDNSLGSGYSGSFKCSYCAVSNMGSPTRNAVSVGMFNAPNPANNLILANVSFFNCGQVFVQSNVNVSLSNVSFAGGINTQDAGEDFQHDDASTNTVTRSISNVSFGNGYKFVSAGPYSITKTFIGGMPQTANAAGMVSGTFSENMVSGNQQDFSFPNSALNYLLMYRFMTTGLAGHMLTVPGTGAYSPGTTQTITNAYVEWPDDLAVNNGKFFITNGANPSSPTQTIASNLLLVPNKRGLGVGFVTDQASINESNNILTVNHGTFWVQGGMSGTSGANVIDEAGASNSVENFQANIFSSDTNFFKSVSSFPSGPSNNTIQTADYNVAATTCQATNSLCPNCTNQSHCWTHKCTAGSGISCPAGVHDLDTTQGGPVLASFVDTSRRIATWDTNGPPSNATCPTWATSTLYTFIAGTKVCVSVSNASVYGGTAINYVLRVGGTHTSGASTQPDSGASWQNVWEPAGLYDLRAALVAGTTYGGNSAVKAFWLWAGAGWTPTNTLYRMTFPGDTNAVTNLGAFQMGDPSSAKVVVIVEVKDGNIVVKIK